MIEHEQKETFVRGMKDELAKASGVIFLDYTGLTVAEVEAMRKKVRATDVKYWVVKNTLMARALSGTSAEGAAKFLKGTPTGVMLGYSDPVSTAKLAMEFTKANNHVKIKGGILESKPITSAETEALSKMASRRELLAQVIGMALGTGRRIAAQIKSPAGRIVGAIEKLAKDGLSPKAS
jgi:large subunit ribosomal protein L10